MPVQALTTSAISSGPTSLRSSRRAPSAGFVGRSDVLQLAGQLLALQVEFVEFLIIVLADDHAARLLFLDRGGQLVVLQLDVHQPLADLLHVAQPALFQLPLLPQVGQLFAQLGHFLLHFGAALLGVLLGLVGQLAIGQFELHQAPLHFVDLAGHALQLHRQPAGGLVHQVDGLVGQEAVGDVAVRQIGRRHQGRILDPHALVMGLVTRLRARGEWRSCLRPTARRHRPAGSAAPRRRPSRRIFDTRRAWWRRCNAARRGPAPASADSPRRCRLRPGPRRRPCAIRR